MYENSGTAYVWTGVDAAECYTSAIIADSKITGDDFVTITIAPMTDGYSIMVNGGTNNGKYIYGTSGSNGTTFGDKASLNTLAYESTGVKITSNTSVMRFNSASDNLRFRYFKSSSYTSQKAVQLYKVVPVAADGITLNTTTLSLGQYKYSTLEATLTPAGATTPIVWTSDNETVATVANGKVTAVGIGSATITATITLADGTSASATCAVTVTAATAITVAQALEIAKTVSADNEIAAGGMYVIRGYVTALYGTPSSDMSTYGNYTVWLADAADGGEVFEAFRVIPTDGKTIAAVGDSVEVIADITKYKTTYETAAGGSISILKLAQYTITATANDDAMGTVAGAGKYDRDSEVTLTAKANDGYEFVNWTNAANETIGTEATLTFTATQDSTIKANFKAEEPLTPATWYGQEPLTGTIEGTTKEYSIVYEITRNADKTLTVKYTINEADLTGLSFLARNLIDANPSTETAYLGKFENNTDGGYILTTTKKFKDGDVLSLKIYMVVKEESSVPTNNYTEVFSYTVGSSNTKPAATYTITTTVNDEAMGTVTGAGKYAENAEVTLTAKANDGYEFVNWTNAANETIGTEATLTFIATQDSTIKANFKAQEPLAPATWYGQEPLTGTVSGVNYSLVYEITRNSTRTLTFKLALNDEAAAVAGMKISIVINNNIVGYITENFTSGVFTTSGYYTDGDELNIQFYLGSNNDGVYASAFNYIVGSSNNKPTAIDSVSAEAKATKRIVNGVLVIEKNGVRYNAQGVVME